MTARHPPGYGPAITTVLAVVLGTGLAMAFAWARGAEIPGLPGAHPTAADADARAAAAIAEVCTTPAQLPRRTAVMRQAQRDPFKY